MALRLLVPLSPNSFRGDAAQVAPARSSVPARTFFRSREQGDRIWHDAKVDAVDSVDIVEPARAG
jgi:hypothetical protein